MAGPSQVTIKIAAQLEKNFGPAISAAQKAVSGLKGLGGMAAGSMKIAAGSLAAVGGALATAGVASVNTGREFEAAMSSAAATASATEAEYKKLEAAAMEMGRTTSKTATESANALEYMSLAGWDVDTSISALPSVLKMSEASGMELAHCSDMITDSMSAAGVSVDNLAGYLDIAAKAQNKSNQSAEQMMEAFIGVGGTMKGLNIPIEDTATALGVLANRGLKGSEAGNALNAIMANLTTGTGAAGKMMGSLGISAFDSEGKFIGLEATLQKVNQATAGLSEEERNAALAVIGGKQHIDALNDLMAGLNTTTADGATEWEALSEQLYSAGGALDAMRNTKLDNLNGDLATLQSALEDTGIRVYKNLQEPLRGAAQFATEQIYTLSDALNTGGFEGMASAVGNVLSNMLAMVALPSPVDNWLKCQQGIRCCGHYMDDYYVILPDMDRLKKLAHEMVLRFAAIGIPVNQRKCKIIPLTRPFKFCKAKFRLLETGRVIVNGCRDGVKRARRKLKLFKEQVVEGKRKLETVKQYMTCQLSYYKGYNDHGRVLRLSRLCYALFGDIMGGTKCIKSQKTGPASA